MVSRRIHKPSPWNVSRKEKSSPFAPRPFAAQQKKTQGQATVLLGQETAPSEVNSSLAKSNGNPQSLHLEAVDEKTALLKSPQTSQLHEVNMIKKPPLTVPRVQRAPIQNWNTREALHCDAILGHLKDLYRLGKHERIAELRDRIDNDRHPTSKFFLNFIDRMMRYTGLNNFVQEVATRGGKKNFARGFVRIYRQDGTIIHSVKTEAQGSGEVEEQVKGEDRWHTAKSKKGKKEGKISLRDSEAAVCDQLHGDIVAWAQKNDEKPMRAELHLVTNNGPCDGCKERINLLMLEIKTLLGEKITVNARVYYLNPPLEKTRGKDEVETTYGWMDDQNGNDQGIYTHDLEA